MPDDLPRAPARETVDAATRDPSARDRAAEGFSTRMSHAGRPAVRSHGFVNPPVHRGSTVLYPSCEARRQVGRQKFEQVMTYGTAGGPTHFTLEDVIAEIEGGTRCTIVGTGLAAVAVPLLAYLRAGDHCLMPDSVYGPARALAEGMLRGWNIETTFYDPLVDEHATRALMRPNTRVVYTESPGSHTFEVQDIPAIARAAHAGGAKVLMDNTWGIHHFQPFRHGVDVSIQALTKYVVGHSDALLGSVTVNDEADWLAVRAAGSAMGHYASPDDCWLALRGVRTMPARLKLQAAAALEVARWLEGRPEVLRVLHPALPSHPQHALWARDFSGACSLFGVVLRPRYDESAMFALIDNLELFGIGASWGGYESLALPTTGFIRRTARRAADAPPRADPPGATDPGGVDAGVADLGGPTFRLHIGLEDTADLLADLGRGLDSLPR